MVMECKGLSSECITNGSTQAPKPTLFLWVALRLLYHKKFFGMGAGEPGVISHHKFNRRSKQKCFQIRTRKN